MVSLIIALSWQFYRLASLLSQNSDTRLVEVAKSITQTLVSKAQADKTAVERITAARVRTFPAIEVRSLL